MNVFFPASRPKPHQSSLGSQKSMDSIVTPYETET
jgi:hypothetical protein